MYRLYVTEYFPMSPNHYEHDYATKEDAHAYIERHIYDSYYPPFVYAICEVSQNGMIRCVETGCKHPKEV